MAFFAVNEEPPGLVTVEVFVSKIEPTAASSLLKVLDKHYPLSEFKHLKRVKKTTGPGGAELYVLLFSKEAFSSSCSVSTTKAASHAEADVGATLPAQLQQFSSLLHPQLYAVPKYPPPSRERLAEWNAMWPCTFHDVPRQTPEVDTFTSDEIESMKRYMQEALAQALLAKEFKQRPIGAVVVDPETGRVLASGFDHSVLCTSCSTTSSAMVQQLPNQNASNLEEEVNPPPPSGTSQTNSAAHTEAEPLPSQATVSVSTPVTAVSFQPHPLHHAAIVCIEEISKHHLEKDTESDDYVCTGYDMYITREPCVMCSMAILHSRFRRVVYGTSNPILGGLHSHYMLHTQRSLNHHFQVYRGLLSKQIIDTIGDL
ncbi:tRNA-specific adenosine deaminase 3 [Pelomyxa schiedti]|nr:tRNA-specific adenosine deaminase 3 [Pelomyxa schiedti]